jgi:DNA (cytosine-5)-methyltransferase 1
MLDLFCGAGGAAVGYHRAGFEVVGVDINPQPHYPFAFEQADAMRVLEMDRPFVSGFDAIHASPPCQRWLGVPGALGESEYPDLIIPTRDLLQRIGLPWVIENVPGAPLDGFILCGASFGLPIVRHRRFETSPAILLAPSACHQSSWERGTGHAGTYPYAHGAWRPAWREHVMPTVWPWMTLEEAGEAIPPAYTEWIGRQLLQVIERRAA